MALIDVLNALEITPDGIIGHSVGEIACAYADGCLTAEETVLGSYYRGQVCTSLKFDDGLMAVIGNMNSEKIFMTHLLSYSR